MTAAYARTTVERQPKESPEAPPMRIAVMASGLTTYGVSNSRTPLTRSGESRCVLTGPMWRPRTSPRA